MDTWKQSGVTPIHVICCDKNKNHPTKEHHKPYRRIYLSPFEIKSKNLTNHTQSPISGMLSTKNNEQRCIYLHNDSRYDGPIDFSSIKDKNEKIYTKGGIMVDEITLQDLTAIETEKNIINPQIVAISFLHPITAEYLDEIIDSSISSISYISIEWPMNPIGLLKDIEIKMSQRGFELAEKFYGFREFNYNPKHIEKSLANLVSNKLRSSALEELTKKERERYEEYIYIARKREAKTDKNCLGEIKGEKIDSSTVDPRKFKYTYQDILLKLAVKERDILTRKEAGTFLSQALNSNPEKPTLENIIKSLHLLQNNQKTSDKWESYFKKYADILDKYIEAKNLKILEIGVQNGGSLELWLNLFGKNATVRGIDINPIVEELRFKGNIKAYAIDALDNKKMNDFFQHEGKFDIIIDDGSHINSDVIQVFCDCFQKLNSGGTYIIEDTHTSYFSSHKGSIDNNAYTMQNFFKEISDFVNLEHIKCEEWKCFENKFPFLSEKILDRNELFFELAQIETIKFGNSIIALIKTENYSANSLGQRFVSIGESLAQKMDTTLGYSRR